MARLDVFTTMGDERQMIDLKWSSHHYSMIIEKAGEIQEELELEINVSCFPLG